MISIVVCSVDHILFHEFHRNVQSTIGVPFEIIRIDNTKNKYSICDAYNKGVELCKFDMICFSHEDVLFETENWGQIISDILSDQNVGMVGIFGAAYVSLFPDPIIDLDECQGQVMEGYKPDRPIRYASRFPGQSLTEVVGVDGVFMVTRKSIMNEIHFSDDILKGFHGYDFDICMQIRNHYKILVTSDILLSHLSKGTYNKSYYKAYEILARKWKYLLPAYTSTYTGKEVRHLKIKSLHILLAKAKTLKQYMKYHLVAAAYAAQHGVLPLWLSAVVGKMIKTSPVSFDRRIKGDDLKTDGFNILSQNLKVYFENHPADAKHFTKEIDFITHKLDHIPEEDKLMYSIFPYPFTFKYKYEDTAVFKDDEAGMFYVLMNGKKLYYHKGFKNALDVQKSFTYISAEQDVESPHRYLDDSFTVGADDVIADLGAAEGNFSLMVVDKVKELVIVESDPIWMDALHKTFEPWKEKVTIINKYAGAHNDEKTITMDRIPSANKINTVKMDIEGAEISVLLSAETYIREHVEKMAVTVYHRHSDAEDIRSILEKDQYQTEFSHGFMLFVSDRLKPPFFRHGLIKAHKAIPKHSLS